MVFRINSVDININIDEIVDEVLAIISEDYNNAIYDCFESLTDVDDFFYNNGNELDRMKKHVKKLVVRKLLEN